jgi:arabinose-5-phosphate isomerase
MGDAIAVALLKRKGFQARDFAFYHPGGNIGKKLLKVSDIMRKGKDHAVVRENRKLKEVLLCITRSRAGSATVADRQGRLTGIFTDGDLRRHLKKGETILEGRVARFMTRHPITIGQDRLAAEAFALLRAKKIDEVPVIDRKGRPVGLLDVQDLLKAGIV